MTRTIQRTDKISPHAIVFSLTIVIVVFAILATTDRAFADVSADFEQAEVYDDNGQYTQAAGLYQSIITQNPGTAHALNAQKELTRTVCTSSRANCKRHKWLIRV